MITFTHFVKLSGKCQCLCQFWPIKCKRVAFFFFFLFFSSKMMLDKWNFQVIFIIVSWLLVKWNIFSYWICYAYFFFCEFSNNLHFTCFVIRVVFHLLLFKPSWMLDTYAAVYTEIFADMKFILVWKVMQSSSFIFWVLIYYSSTFQYSVIL